MENDFTTVSIPKDRINILNKRRQKISDYIAVRKTYLSRLKQWDGWCRKGPWLIEEGSPGTLISEIKSVKRYISGEDATCPSWLQKDSQSFDPNDGSLLKLAEVNLKKNRRYGIGTMDSGKNRRENYCF